MNRRHLLYLGLSTATTGIMKRAGAVSSKQQSMDDLQNLPPHLTVVGEFSLQERAAAKGLIYGAATGFDFLVSDLDFKKKFLQECGILVPENDIKWFNIRSISDNFDFSKVDHMLAFSNNNEMLFRGHTLIWHNANPKWLIKKFKKSDPTSKKIENLLINHVSTVARRYAGKVHSWDVVNEAINVSDGQKGGFRDTTKSGVGIKKDKYPTWFNFLGMDYIDLAFRVAAEADPTAMLTYNDYGLEYDIPWQEAKRGAVLNLLRRLQTNQTPIHAFGLQSHLQGHEKRFNPTKLRNFLHDIADLGLKIIITELDVADHKLPRDIQIRDRMVADAYYEYLSVVLDEPAVIGVLTWGLSDRYTWLSQRRPRPDGAPVRPLPLDADLNRKPAWYAIARAFDNAPPR